MPKGTVDILNASYKVYETLQVLLLFYEGKIDIHTKDGSIRQYNDITDLKDSIDGKLHYKNHSDMSDIAFFLHHESLQPHHFL